MLTVTFKTIGMKKITDATHWFNQRWQSIPSRSIWLEIGSRLIEPSKGLGSKYRALNRTELKWLDDRTEPSQPSYTIEPSRTFNLNARCSIKRLDLARSF